MRFSVPNFINLRPLRQMFPHFNAETPPPNWLLIAMEWRALWEFGSLAPAWPVLQRAPRGDGHAVLVFPGLSASDASTLPLRHYLASLGYQATGWNQGYNFGPRAGVLAAAVSQITELFETTGGKKVSLIGWSLGGVYARELAKLLPEKVRLVITLGTPFVGSPRSTNAWRVYEMTRGRKVDEEMQHFELEKSPSVPTTSVYSRTDGVVSWKCSIQPKQKHNRNIENIEVLASHIGIGLNPTAWWIVADRLAQPEGSWKPFTRAGKLQGLLFPERAQTSPA